MVATTSSHSSPDLTNKAGASTSDVREVGGCVGWVVVGSMFSRARLRNGLCVVPMGGCKS